MDTAAFMNNKRFEQRLAIDSPMATLAQKIADEMQTEKI
jgi:hypothetical protein